MRRIFILPLKFFAIFMITVIMVTGFTFLFCTVMTPVSSYFTDVTALSLSAAVWYADKNDKTEKISGAKKTNNSKQENGSSGTVMTVNSIPEDKRKSVRTKTIDKSGANLSFGNVYVKNNTKNHTINIKKLLSEKSDVNIKKNDKVQVLIMHTHTTECYMPLDIGVYSTDWQSRSSNSDENMVAVGRIVTDKLNDAGIKTVQAEKIHDKPYTGAYERSEKTVKEYLKKYPDIQVVLDLHRDAITYDDGTKLKPTVEINEKNAAQIMIINGCEEGDVTDYPDWETNMVFALKLQKEIDDTYPGLTRPLYFAVKKYNQHLTHGSLLVEMGSEANTLEEAKYSAELLSDCLISLLLEE